MTITYDTKEMDTAIKEGNSFQDRLIEPGEYPSMVEGAEIRQVDDGTFWVLVTLGLKDGTGRKAKDALFISSPYPVSRHKALRKLATYIKASGMEANGELNPDDLLFAEVILVVTVYKSQKDGKKRNDFDVKLMSTQATDANFDTLAKKDGETIEQAAAATTAANDENFVF